MKTDRRDPANKMALLIGVIFVLSVSSCFSPHYRDYKTYELPGKFEPIPVERANGIYATVGYLPSSKQADIELEAEPVITPKDIQEIRKTTLHYSDTYPLIELKLTEEGSRKLYVLTKANIGKPIAIVVENRIVAMPMVVATVVEGLISIAGGFPEDEIERIIDILREEQKK